MKESGEGAPLIIWKDLDVLIFLNVHFRKFELKSLLFRRLDHSKNANMHSIFTSIENPLRFYTY